MGSLRTAALFLKEGVQIRARFPNRPHVRVLGVSRHTARYPVPPHGGDRDVPETIIRYAYKLPDPHEGEDPWRESTLVIREWQGRPQIDTHLNGLGLDFEAPYYGSGGLGLWVMTLPLSALFPLWLGCHGLYLARERLTKMTRYARAAYHALAPHLDDETRALLKDAAHRHWEERHSPYR